MKRKPYSKGRIMHGPPAGWKNVTRPGWLVSEAGHYHGFISFWGRVYWHSRRAKWYAAVREMTHDPGTGLRSPGGFSRVREAMMSVEQQFSLRARRKKWSAILR